ncbi:MAG: DegT/DnrJ/EryC1/StrS family aminotransferase [bacterium]|nr:DegT/DnrJ/EryC1/StrS family aminotransferase [bacterium]
MKLTSIKESGKLAILGGKPVFNSLIPMVRPSLPPFKGIENRLKETFSSGLVTNAKYVELLEKKIAQYLNVKHAVCVANCTLGLILGIKALKLKGKIIVPSFTFCASVHALIWNNLTPIFVDCHQETFNIDLTSIEKYITKDTSAIMAVHIFGNPAQVEELNKIAHKYSLKVIYDAAHAFGSSYKNKPLAGFGEMEVFSLSPTKVLVAGEGGIVATNNKRLADEIRIGRDYGNPGNYNCEFVGLNARMLEISAIIALENLELLPERLVKRKKLINLYLDNLKNIPGISFQKIEKDSSSCYKDFAILIDPAKFGLDRNILALVLEKENISSRKYFFPPVHKQNAYEKEFIQENLVNTNFISEHILCLPLYNHMKEKDILNICQIIKKAYQYAPSIKEKLS